MAFSPQHAKDRLIFIYHQRTTVAGSYFSSGTLKGYKKRFDKDKVTSYKGPEGQDVPRVN